MKYMRYLFASIIIGIILLLSSCFNGEIEDEYTTETMFPAGIDEEYTIETMFSEELRRATTVEVSDKVLFDQLIITDDTAEMLPTPAERSAGQDDKTCHRRFYSRWFPYRQCTYPSGRSRSDHESLFRTALPNSILPCLPAVFPPECPVSPRQWVP